jgi:hypothetical protein
MAANRDTANIQSVNNVDASDDTVIDEDIDISADIYCAVAECNGCANYFCQRLTAKCRSRKFCEIHGTLCSRHEHQRFKEEINSIDLDEDKNSESDSSIDAAMDSLLTVSPPFVGPSQTQLEVDPPLYFDPPQVHSSMSLIELANEAIRGVASTYNLEPVNNISSKRLVKLGVMVLYNNNQVWKLSKVYESRFMDKVRLNFVEDSMVWLDVVLRSDEHGPEYNKWILLQKRSISSR